MCWVWISSELSDEALYRNLDRLYPNRKPIEQALAQREKSLFNLDDTYLLYDLTSTYFEGQCLHNPKAQRALLHFPWMGSSSPAQQR